MIKIWYETVKKRTSMGMIYLIYYEYLIFKFIPDGLEYSSTFFLIFTLSILPSNYQTLKRHDF